MDFIFIDPLKLKEDFYVVLSDERRGFIPWIIKSHTKGNWNHVMVSVKKGKFATQLPNGYKEVDFSHYMTNSQSLKFFRFPKLTHQEFCRLQIKITEDLSQPWWKNRYDFLGIIGQFLHMPWINNPWTKYCSERVASYLKLIGIPCKPHATPSEINVLLNSCPDAQYIGHWFKD